MSWKQRASELMMCQSPAQLLLEWFYGRGESLFYRSTMGGMLDKLERDSMGSRRCPDCNPWVEEARSNAHAKCSAIDWEQGFGTPGVLRDGEWCPRCKGTGHITYRRVASKDPPTVGLMGREYHVAGYCPDDAELTRHAQVSRWLMHLERSDPRLGQAIECFHGNDGVSSASVVPYGRFVAVMPHTDAGKVWLDSVRTQAWCSLRPIERIRSELTLQAVQPSIKRLAALDSAWEQATYRVADATRTIDLWLQKAREHD